MRSTKGLYAAVFRLRWRTSNTKAVAGVACRRVAVGVGLLTLSAGVWLGVSVNPCLADDATLDALGLPASSDQPVDVGVADLRRREDVVLRRLEGQRAEPVLESSVLTFLSDLYSAENVPRAKAILRDAVARSAAAESPDRPADAVVGPGVEEHLRRALLTAQAAAVLDDAPLRRKAEAAAERLLESIRDRSAGHVFDAKIGVEQGALVASALFRMGGVLGRKDLTQSAVRVLDIVARLNTPEAGALVTTGLTAAIGLAAAFVDGYEATGREPYLERGRVLAVACAESLTDPDAETRREEPGSHGVADLAVCLMRLHHITGQEDLKTRARRLAEFSRNQLSPGAGTASAAAAARALRWTLLAPVHIVIIGPRGRADTVVLRQAVAALPATFRVVDPIDPAVASQKARLDRLGYPVMDEAMAFLCAAQTCAAPASNAKELREAFDRLAK